MNYKPLPPNIALIGENGLLWLYEKALEMDSIVEVGSFKGGSAHALLSGCKGIVYCVDHFKGSAEEGDATHGQSGKEDFIKNVGHFENLRLLEMSSEEAAGKFEDDSVDMVMIDAGHLYEEFHLDLTLWLKKTKKLICGHDVNSTGVNRALREVIETWKEAPDDIWYWEAKK